MNQVFISHSSDNAETAAEVCRFLEERGIRCWLAPRDIEPGADWAESILTAIDESSAMILLISRSSTTSPHIRREVERAVSRRSRILPLYMERVEPPLWMQYYISAHQWIDGTGSDLDQRLSKIADSLTREHRREGQGNPTVSESAVQPHDDDIRSPDESIEDQPAVREPRHGSGRFRRRLLLASAAVVLLAAVIILTPVTSVFRSECSQDRDEMNFRYSFVTPYEQSKWISRSIQRLSDDGLLVLTEESDKGSDWSITRLDDSLEVLWQQHLNVDSLDNILCTEGPDGSVILCWYSRLHKHLTLLSIASDGALVSRLDYSIPNIRAGGCEIVDICRNQNGQIVICGIEERPVRLENGRTSNWCLWIAAIPEEGEVLTLSIDSLDTLTRGQLGLSSLGNPSFIIPTEGGFLIALNRAFPLTAVEVISLDEQGSVNGRSSIGGLEDSTELIGLSESPVHGGGLLSLITDFYGATNADYCLIRVDDSGVEIGRTPLVSPTSDVSLVPPMETINGHLLINTYIGGLFRFSASESELAHASLLTLSEQADRANTWLIDATSLSDGFALLISPSSVVVVDEEGQVSNQCELHPCIWTETWAGGVKKELWTERRGCSLARPPSLSMSFRSDSTFSMSVDLNGSTLTSRQVFRWTSGTRLSAWVYASSGPNNDSLGIAIVSPSWLSRCLLVPFPAVHSGCSISWLGYGSDHPYLRASAGAIECMVTCALDDPEGWLVKDKWQELAIQFTDTSAVFLVNGRRFAETSPELFFLPGGYGHIELMGSSSSSIHLFDDISVTTCWRDDSLPLEFVMEEVEY